MSELLTRMLNLGLGLASVTQEKAEEIVGELMKSGQLAKDQASEVVDELVEKGDQSRGELFEAVRHAVESTLTKMNVPTRAEFEKLEKRIAHLESVAERHGQETDGDSN